MARRRERTAFPRMIKSWAIEDDFVTALTANVTSLQVSGTFAEPTTIMRYLLEYLIAPTAGGTFAAGDRCLIGVGIGVNNTEAVAVGSTAMPDPIDDVDFPWLYWAVHAIHFVTATESDQLGSQMVRAQVDVKGMRKLRVSDSVFTVVQYEDLSGTPPMTIIGGTARILTAVH